MTAGQSTRGLYFWQVLPDVLVYKLHSDGAAEDDEVDDGVPAYCEWELPNTCAISSTFLTLLYCLPFYKHCDVSAAL